MKYVFYILRNSVYIYVFYENICTYNVEPKFSVLVYSCTFHISKKYVNIT